VFHVDKGIFYTIKELLVRPKDTIKGYLEGKRINYFRPFAFIIILGTVYAFIAHFFQVYPESVLMPDMGAEITQRYNIILEWLYGHYSIMMLAVTPLYALSTYWVFRKSGYNYLEHLVIYAYIMGIQIFLSLVCYGFYYYFSSVWIVVATVALGYCYNIWVLVQFFHKGSWLKTVVKAIISFILAFIMVFITSSLISAIYYVIYYAIYNEAVQ